MKRLVLLAAMSLAAVALAACDLPPPDPARIAAECEARAHAAQGPTGTVSVGLNSERGAFTEASIGLTSDFLQGRDPVAVYEQCIYQRTGALPVTTPRLN